MGGWPGGPRGSSGVVRGGLWRDAADDRNEGHDPADGAVVSCQPGKEPGVLCSSAVVDVMMSWNLSLLYWIGSDGTWVSCRACTGNVILSRLGFVVSAAMWTLVKFFCPKIAPCMEKRRASFAVLRYVLIFLLRIKPCAR